MTKNKYNEGFTLVELVVAMATSTLVFAAAATILLLGIRINNMTTGTTIRQNTTRTVLTVLERMATEGRIAGVMPDASGWKITGEEEEVLFSYDSEDQRIYVGDKETMLPGEKESNTLMGGVYASHVVMDADNVLTIAVETEDGSYRSSVYCRLLRKNQEEDDSQEDSFVDVVIPEIDPDTSASRKAFLDVISSQYRLKNGAPNPGIIQDMITLNGEQNQVSTGLYYSEWYITTKEGMAAWGKNGWNKDTPWCACFVSWALSKVEGTALDGTAPMFAEVDGFMDSFDEDHWKTTNPKAGDLIFFDWSVGNDPDHVGVVLKTEGGYVFTVEGNSAGMVAVRMYKLTDKRIIGYGVLTWKQP